MADGKRISIYSVGVAVKLRLGDLEFEHSTAEVQIERNILLGTDFLKEQQSVLDFQRGTINLSSYHRLNNNNLLLLSLWLIHICSLGQLVIIQKQPIGAMFISTHKFC